MLNTEILEKYASLIASYCLEVKAGDRVLINTTTEAIPLLLPLQKNILNAGGVCDFILEWHGQNQNYWQEASRFALEHISPLLKAGFEEYECYLNIRAPFLQETQKQNSSFQKTTIRNKALENIQQTYFRRIGTPTRDLKRNLCQFPTLSAANMAGMTLEEYENFVVKACFLDHPNPRNKWMEISQMQQIIVDYLNQCTEIRYLASHTDISFKCKNRIWINSDGKNNMPSGEVFTSPIEDSVNGFITFTIPGHYNGQKTENVRLEVKDGFIESWSADVGQAILDQVFQIEGTRRFGEAAIGTNQNIQQVTNNILFDEKIGGTIHMAIGQSYQQCLGKNQSTVHWDMITDMSNGGQIWADGHLIYESGKFLIL